MTPHDRSLQILPWRDSFAMGVAEIDMEHRRLFEEANRLTEAILSEAIDKPSLDSLLLHMVAGHRAHFNHEEAVMHRYGFRGLDDHAVEHQKVLQSTDERVRRFLLARRTDLDALVDIAIEVKDELLDHFLHYDLRYKSHLMAARGL